MISGILIVLSFAFCIYLLIQANKDIDKNKQDLEALAQSFVNINKKEKELNKEYFDTIIQILIKRLDFIYTLTFQNWCMFLVVFSLIALLIKIGL